MLRVAELTKRFGGFVGVIDARLTVPSNISSSLVGGEVKGRGTHEAV
jgi:ABC-type branched-subunit amino acid transport system ATPase component